MLNVRTEHHGDLLILLPEGRLDTATAPAFDQSVQTHTNAGTRLLIDLTQVH
jgi:anti-anti-sigma regulatory factor